MSFRGKLCCAAVLLLATALLNGCGSDSTPPPSGKVVQGPVHGATVFADKIVSGTTGDYVMDSAEAATETLTDAQGNFKLPVTPAYNYVVVSKGGTDTSTGLPAIQLLAPAGSANISPLTTLVALDPTAKTKIETLGVKYDADISKSSTSAALLLAKSVETTIKTLTNAFAAAATTGGTSLTSAQVAVIQSTVATAIATEIAKPTSTLTDASSLKGVLTTALTTGLDAVKASPTMSNVTVTASSASVAATIADVVTTVATQIGPISTTTPVVETTIFTPTSAATTAVNGAISTTSSSVSTSVSVTPDTTPPTVTLVTPADGATGVALNSVITATFSEPINTATFSISGLAGSVSYNGTTNTVTFTPAAPLAANTTYTVTIGTNVKDLAGNALATAKTWTFTTPTVTGTTGGSGSVNF